VNCCNNYMVRCHSIVWWAPCQHTRKKLDAKRIKMKCQVRPQTEQKRRLQTAWFCGRAPEHESNRPGQEPELMMFFLVFELLLGKCLDWSTPLWFATLDLTKPFDRVEYDPVFETYCGMAFPNRIVRFLRAYINNRLVVFTKEKKLQYKRAWNKEMSSTPFCSMLFWNQQDLNGNWHCATMV